MIDPEAVAGMNERERLMLMNSHLPENKGPNTFTLSLRKMVNGAPPPPRSTKKRTLLKAIVTTAAQEEEVNGASNLVAAAAPRLSSTGEPVAEAPLAHGSMRRPGNAPSRFMQRDGQSRPGEENEDISSLGRFARVGKYMVHARRFHARLKEYEVAHGLSPSGSDSSQYTSPGVSPGVSPRMSPGMVAAGARPLSAGTSSHTRGVSDCGPPMRVDSRRISAPMPSRSMANMVVKPDASPLASLLPPELLPTLVVEGSPAGPPGLQHHKSVPGLLSPLLRLQLQQHAMQSPPPPSIRHSHNNLAGLGGGGSARTARLSTGDASADMPWPPEVPSTSGSPRAEAGAEGAAAWAGAGTGAQASGFGVGPGGPGAGLGAGEASVLTRVSEGGHPGHHDGTDGGGPG